MFPDVAKPLVPPGPAPAAQWTQPLAQAVPERPDMAADGAKLMGVDAEGYVCVCYRCLAESC